MAGARGREPASGIGCCSCSSAGVTGNVNGGRTASASAAVPKQRTGVLRLTPRGSKPTTSKRARSTGGRNCDQVADEVDTRAARAAGVDHQRPDPLTPGGRRTTDHRQRDRGPARVVVVQRRTNRRALEAVAARLPRHRARRQTRNRPRVRHGGRPASHRGEGPGGGRWHQRSDYRSHQGEAGRCDGDVPSMPGTCGLGEHEPPHLRRKPARRAGCTHRSCPAAGPARLTRSWDQLYRCAALMTLTIHGSPARWACQGRLSPVARQGRSLPPRSREFCRAGLHVESETVKSSTTKALWAYRGPAQTRPPRPLREARGQQLRAARRG